MTEVSNSSMGRIGDNLGRFLSFMLTRLVFGKAVATAAVG